MQARAPGKIILSGEHAVVYGQPALVIAVDHYAVTRFSPTTSAEFSLQLPGCDLTVMTGADLSRLTAEVDARYARFRDGELAVTEVLRQPFDLAPIALQRGLQALPSPPSGGRLTLELGIPVGAGMGASAAVVLSVLQAVAGPANPSRETLYEWAVACEKLQHGQTSGVDPYACLHGGCALFSRGTAEDLVGSLPPFFLVNSGRPACSTGECVAQVRRDWGASNIWPAFAAVTIGMRRAIDGADQSLLRKLVRENQSLLAQLGLTPPPVADFIREIEAAGGAAKISGAGAVAGPAAGMLLVFADAPPTAICDRYGYELLEVNVDADGTRICPG